MCKNELPNKIFYGVNRKTGYEGIGFGIHLDVVKGYLKSYCMEFSPQENEDGNQRLSMEKTYFLGFEFEANFFFDRHSHFYSILYSKHFERKELALNLYYRIKRELEVIYANPKSEFECTTYVCEGGSIYLLIEKTIKKYSVGLSYIKNLE